MSEGGSPQPTSAHTLKAPRSHPRYNLRPFPNPTPIEVLLAQMHLYSSFGQSVTILNAVFEEEDEEKE